MEQKLIITRQDDKIISAFYQGRDMVQVSVNTIQQENILGNIYLGKVKNIVKNINAAFVEIAGGQMCYLAIGENQRPIMANDSHERPEGRKIQIGDELIVQVSKEDVKTKAPVVTTNINLTGKYAALIYGKSSMAVSSKIEDDKERKRLRHFLNQYQNRDYGFIARTNAAYLPEEVVAREIDSLTAAFEEIRTHGVHRNAFTLIYRTPPNYICDIRDGYANQVDEFLTDDRELYENIRAYLEQFQSEDLEKIRLYEDDTVSLSTIYGIQDKLKDALRSTVWLKSGGTIIIQPTEALTVIDVNTGKAVTGKKKVQETFLKVNREAAKEIAKQIRLRNLSGIIIIDFIDMELKQDKELLMEELEKYFHEDPIQTTLVDMTTLGLVEVTRKKVRKPLYEQM